MMISLGGGAIGIALGVGSALLTTRVSALVQLDLPIVALATAFAVATGLFFGYYPARKASLLDSIEALRQ